MRFLEYLFISAFNRARDRREAPARVEPIPLPAPPPDYTILGHLLPEEEGPPEERLPVKPPSAGVVTLSPEARRRHLYILGATGTGKTNLLLRLIESDIQNQRAFCVIDLRGDLVDRVLLRLAVAAPPDVWRERLLLLDLRDNEHVVGFNPLSGEGEVYSRALHVLSVLKTQSESWGVQLEETLRNCLLALAETGWTLLEVEPLLTNAGFRAEVLRGVRDSRVRSFFERYGKLSSANQTTWALAALNKITPLLSIPTLRLLLGQRRGFPFRHLFDTQSGMVVLVSLAVDRLHEAARLTGGLLVSSFQSAILSRLDVPERDRVPVNLYVDEFESMASDRFETIVAEGRRFGLGLTLSHQNLSQMSSNLRHVLRNNVHTQVYFQTGALDAADLSKEISGGKSDEDVRRILMSQGVGEAYLVRRGQPSARIKVLHSPDPRLAAARVQAVRATSLSTYARLRADVEAELEERERGYNPRQNTEGEEARPTYEIRHAKTTQFKPKDAQDRNDAQDQEEPPQPPPREPEETVKPADAKCTDVKSAAGKPRHRPAKPPASPKTKRSQ